MTSANGLFFVSYQKLLWAAIGVLIWLLILPALNLAAGLQTFWILGPAILLMVLIPFQETRLAQQWTDLQDNLSGFVFRLAPHSKQSRYAAMAYFCGKTAIPAIGAIVFGQTLAEVIAPLAINVSSGYLGIAFIAICFASASTGVRAVSLLLFVFAIPSLLTLLYFCIAGLGELKLGEIASHIINPAQGRPDAHLFLLALVGVFCCTSEAPMNGFARRAQRGLLPLILLSVAVIFIQNLAPQAQNIGDAAFLNLLNASLPFWGKQAYVLSVFLIVSAAFLLCVTSFIQAPRVLQQMALDGQAAACFNPTGNKEMSAPALIGSLGLCLFYFFIHDLSRILLVSGTAYLSYFLVWQLGLWRARKTLPLPWPWLSLFCLIAGSGVLFAGLAGQHRLDVLLGLFLPTGVIMIDALLQHTHLRKFRLAWWPGRKKPLSKKHALALQVFIPVLQVCVAAGIAWQMSAWVDGIRDGNLGSAILTMLILSLAFLSVVITGWTTLPQLNAIENARNEALSETTSLLQNTLEAILVVGADQTIRLANPAAERLLNLDSFELLGQPLQHILPNVPLTESGISEHPLPASAKQSGTIEVSLSTIHNDNSSEHLITLRNITERKQAADWLNKKNAELDERNKELESMVMVLEMASQQIEKANREFEAANQDLQNKNEELKTAHMQLLQSEKMASIGQLAAGVAHEINNPVGYVKSNLGTLKGYADDLVRLLNSHEALIEAVENQDSGAALSAIQAIRVLAKEVDAQFIVEDLATLTSESQDGIERVRQIVQGLKDFSRVDQQQEQEFNVNDCLESTLKIVLNELKYKAELIKDLGPVPDIFGFPHQLNQVFMNLMVNAAQAMQERGNIWLRSFVQDNYVVVEVEDSGSGIPEAVIHKIFDPFFTTKPVGQGTGLGLSISYGIVQSHNGKLEVESKMGVGTKFRILLPMAA